MDVNNDNDIVSCSEDGPPDDNANNSIENGHPDDDAADEMEDPIAPNSCSERTSITSANHEDDVDDDDDDHDDEVSSIVEQQSRMMHATVRKEVADIRSSTEHNNNNNNNNNNQNKNRNVSSSTSASDHNNNNNNKQKSSQPRSRRSLVSTPATIPEHEVTANSSENNEAEAAAGTTKTTNHHQISLMPPAENGHSSPSKKNGDSTTIPTSDGVVETDMEDVSYHFNQSSSLHSQATSSSHPQSPRRRSDEEQHGLNVSPTSGKKLHNNNGHHSSTAKLSPTRTNNNDRLMTRRSGHRRTANSGHSNNRSGGGANRPASSSSTGGPRITWKADPTESFSDWKLEICYGRGDGGNERDVYYIHRNVCGFGPRKSDYLLHDFRTHSTSSSPDEEACVTRLELPPPRADVFPMILDFMYYSKESKQTLTAERACHVFKLAELLSIPSLQNAIADFYMKNLSIKNMGEFLTAATQTKAEGLLVVSKAKIGQMITEKPELSALVPPKFLADILMISRKQLDEAREREPTKYSEELVKSQSRYWSKAAWICAAHNEEMLTRKLFDALTSEESLPFIDASVAPKLLVLDAKLNRQQLEGDHNKKRGNDNDNNNKMVGGRKSFTSLQRRCVDSIGDDFRAFQRCFPSPEAVSETLTEVPSHVLAAILVKSMNWS